MRMNDEQASSARAWKTGSQFEGEAFWREGMRNFLGQVIVLDEFGNKYVWSPILNTTFPLKEENLKIMGIPDVDHTGTLGFCLADLAGAYGHQVLIVGPYRGDNWSFSRFRQGQVVPETDDASSPVLHTSYFKALESAWSNAPAGGPK